MTPDNQDPKLTDLADGTLAGPEWEAWLAAHPEAAAQVAVARRVRALMRELEAAAVAVPEGFEERLMARLRQDRTLLDLLDLGLLGAGRALIELLNILLSLLPAPQPAPQPAN
jgi:anti-sigma factor RsiW